MLSVYRNRRLALSRFKRLSARLKQLFTSTIGTLLGRRGLRTESVITVNYRNRAI